MRRLIAALVAIAGLVFTLALSAPAGAQVSGIDYIGFTPGAGTGEVHPGANLVGWQTAQKNTGTFAGVFKDFDSAAGYPNLPTKWAGNMATFAANNGGHPLLPLLAFNNVPSAGNFESLMGSLPANQPLGFIFQSEAEASGSGISGPTFLADWNTISNNLNAALTYMAAHPASGTPASFYTRSHFMMINAAYMAYYQAHPGSTAYVPPLSETQAYGADFYQHIGGKQSVGLQSDPRYQGYLKAVYAKAGTHNVPLAFPEYGIGMASYSAANENARAALLKKDIAYLTGTSRPSGTNVTVALVYWYQMDAAPDHYTFPLIPGETVAQAAPTINEWKSVAG